jgi:hypothetical protein
MSGPEFAFEVRPRSLAAYTESLHACAADLTAVGEAVAAVRVEREWFGKLPQSGFLADRYAAHKEQVLAQVRELSAWFAAARLGLAESAERYSAADRVVAELAEDVRADDNDPATVPGTSTSTSTDTDTDTDEARR